MWWTLLIACRNAAPPADPAPPVEAPRRSKARRAEAVLVRPASRDPRWADARCNDGTPAALRMRAGTEDVWVLKVAGGFFCEDDKVPCRERERRLTTTTPGEDGGPVDLARAGLFSPDPRRNPTFATAHHVQLDYCSSDLWLGTSVERQPTTGSADGWYFSGAAILRADLEALTTLGLDDADPDTRVLVVGHSAGGAGVVGQLATFATVLPKTVAGGRLKVVLDGSFIPPADVARLPAADRWGPIEPTCDASTRAHGGDPTTCIFGPQWWGPVQAFDIPILVALSGLDLTQTRVFLPEKTPEAAARWKAGTRAALAPLPWVFSGGHPYHVVSFEDGFDEGPPDGPTFERFVTRFWEGGAPEQVIWGYDP